MHDRFREAIFYERRIFYAEKRNKTNRTIMCSMIHNPSIGNPTHVTDGAIDYTFNENLSQGYYVQTFKDAILFNGANICDQKIYPSYCYIIDGKTSAQKQVVKPVTLYKDVKVAADSLQQTQISDRYAA